MTTTLLILARFFHLGSGLILAGVVAFRWFVLLPALVGATGETWRAFTPFFRRLHQAFLASGIVLVLSGVVLFGAVAAGMSGMSLKESLNVETWSTVLFHTQFGAVTQVRFGLALLLGFLLWKLNWHRWLEKTVPSYGERVIGSIALLLLATFAATGHAATASGWIFLPRIAIDALHLSAAAVWPMGLLPFALFLSHARRMDAATSQGPALRVMGRFSTLSFATVVLLTGTGLLNVCFLVGDWRFFFSTGYGELLGLKLVLYALILVLAAWNRYHLLPVLFSGAAQKESGSLFRELHAFVLDELMLTVAVIAVVSILGVTAPPG